MAKKKESSETRTWWKGAWIWVDVRLSSAEQEEALLWARETAVLQHVEQLLSVGYFVDIAYDHRAGCPLVVIKYPYADSVEGGHRLSTRARTLEEALDMALYKFEVKLGGKLAGHAEEPGDQFG